MIGEVFVDYHLDLTRLRLGGIAHAGRALWAFGARWAGGYFAPRYLDSACASDLLDHGATQASLVGETLGAPNLIVIRDSPEAGSQGYDDVLRNARTTDFQPSAVRDLIEGFNPDHVLIFPGAFPLEEVLRVCEGRPTSIDAQYATGLAPILQTEGRTLETVFCSTSSTLFREEAGGDFSHLSSLIPPTLARNLILKENRGGSRVATPDGDVVAGAYLGDATHSVGVGDCFDVAWILGQGDPPSARLNRASYLAQLYASTQEDESWKAKAADAIANDATISVLRGKRLAWEDRPEKVVYLAAPDFPDVETSALDDLAGALRYHNFGVVRPISDFGLVTEETTVAERSRIYELDMAAIRAASMVIVVPLVPDEGTFVELGIAAAAGIPTIIYDIVGGTRNMFAVSTASTVCRSRADVIRMTFDLLSTTAP